MSPFPTGPSSDLPDASHEDYENAIRDAGRTVGGLYLDRREFAKAWGFYRMLGEQERMFAALDTYEPAPDDDTYGIVEIAWQHGVHPQKGFDILLSRSGVCSAITMVGSANLAANPDLREYCVKKLVRALHDQLKDRLHGELAARNIELPADATVPQLIAGAPDLFGEDMYHIDVSHLSSVVQLASSPSPISALKRATTMPMRSPAPSVPASISSISSYFVMRILVKVLYLTASSGCKYPVTCRSNPAMLGILRCFASKRIFATFRSRRICAPMP